MIHLKVRGGQVYRDGELVPAKLRTLGAARRGIVSKQLRHLVRAALGEEVVLELEGPPVAEPSSAHEEEPGELI